MTHDLIQRPNPDGITRPTYPAEEAMDDAWMAILSCHHISPPLMKDMTSGIAAMINLVNDLGAYGLQLQQDNAKLVKERDDAFKEGRRIGRMTRARLRMERDEALEKLKTLGEKQ